MDWQNMYFYTHLRMYCTIYRVCAIVLPMLMQSVGGERVSRKEGSYRRINIKLERKP